MKLNIILPLVISFSALSSAASFKRNSGPLRVLQNLFTAFSTDILSLDKAILSAKSPSDAGYIFRNITKLEQTIQLATRTLNQSTGVTDDLASTLQSFGEQLTNQVLKTFTDLNGKKELIAEVPGGLQAVLVDLTAVRSASVQFVDGVQTKIPLGSWTGAAIPQINRVLVGLNNIIKTYET
jgi:hypothetical protein